MDYSHTNFEIGTKDNVKVSTEVSCCITSVGLRAVDLTGEEYNSDFMEGAGAGELSEKNRHHRHEKIMMLGCENLFCRIMQPSFSILSNDFDDIIDEISLSRILAEAEQIHVFYFRIHLRHGIRHPHPNRVGDLQLG